MGGVYTAREGCLSLQPDFVPPGMHLSVVIYKYVQVDNRKLCYDSSVQWYDFILTYLHNFCFQEKPGQRGKMQCMGVLTGVNVHP